MIKFIVLLSLWIGCVSYAQLPIFSRCESNSISSWVNEFQGKIGIQQRTERCLREYEANNCKEIAVLEPDNVKKCDSTEINEAEWIVDYIQSIWGCMRGVKDFSVQLATFFWNLPDLTHQLYEAATLPESEEAKAKRVDAINRRNSECRQWLAGPKPQSTDDIDYKWPAMAKIKDKQLSFAQVSQHWLTADQKWLECSNKIYRKFAYEEGLQLDKAVTAFYQKYKISIPCYNVRARADLACYALATLVPIPAGQLNFLTKSKPLLKLKNLAKASTQSVGSKLKPLFSFRIKPSNGMAIGDFTASNYRPIGEVKTLTETRALNQCRAKECYLFAMMGFMETQNANILGKMDAPPMSAPYLFAHKMEKYIDDVVKYGASNYALEGGGTWDSLSLAHDFGLVPEASWTPKVPYKDWDFARIYNTVRTEAPKLSDELSELAEAHGHQSPIYKAAKENGVKKIKDVLHEYTGDLPTTVDFKNQKLSTKDIERMYGMDHRNAIFAQYPAQRWQAGDWDLTIEKMKSITEPYGAGFQIAPATKEEIEQNIIKWLDNKSPVLADLDWGKRELGHVLVIDGYEMQNGKVVRFKLKNSWGPTWGNNGHDWYTADDLYKNLRATWRFAAPNQ